MPNNSLHARAAFPETAPVRLLGNLDMTAHKLRVLGVQCLVYSQRCTCACAATARQAPRAPGNVRRQLVENMVASREELVNWTEPTEHMRQHLQRRVCRWCMSGRIPPLQHSLLAWNRYSDTAILQHSSTPTEQEACTKKVKPARGERTGSEEGRIDYAEHAVQDLRPPGHTKIVY